MLKGERRSAKTTVTTTNQVLFVTHDTAGKGTVLVGRASAHRERMSFEWEARIHEMQRPSP